LVSLILEKDYASISIKEITGRAEVAYITFYRHYESLDQLLMKAFEEGLRELMKRFETLAQQSSQPPALQSCLPDGSYSHDVR
jgi:AcrR family transcriptional regulator